MLAASPAISPQILAVALADAHVADPHHFDRDRGDAPAIAHDADSASELVAIEAHGQTLLGGTFGTVILAAGC